MVSSKLKVPSASCNIIITKYRQDAHIPHCQSRKVMPIQFLLPNAKDIITLFGLPWFAYDFIILSIKMSFAMLVATCRIGILPPLRNLSGGTVLITGTGRGVGKELAIQLSALGCTVVCWDSDRYANRVTMNKILGNGGKVYGFVVDVSNRDEVFQTASMMHSAGIPDVTILINNQAVLLHQPFLRHDSQQLEETFRVNVMSNFWTLEAFLPSMIRNNKGHIVSVAGVCGIYGMANKVPYCASRFAVTGLMEALEEELRLQAEKSRINFTTVYPFSIDSEFAGLGATGAGNTDKQQSSFGYKHSAVHSNVTIVNFPRFPYIFGAVSPKYAAQETIKAIGRNYAKYSVPRGLLMLNSINRMLPESMQRLLVDYLGIANRS